MSKDRNKKKKKEKKCWRAVRERQSSIRNKGKKEKK